MTVAWDTLKEGDELPSLEIRPDLGMVIRYCALHWAFPSFFYDVDAARAAGMPGTLVPGPLKAGLLYRALDEWLDGAGYVRQVRAAHRRPDTTNQPLILTGRVARLYEEDGKHRADLEMVVLNKDGEPSVRGFGVVEFT